MQPGADPSQHILFAFLGVPWKWTRKAWFFIPTRIGLCMGIALLVLRDETILARVLSGLVYALALMLSQGLHVIGHTLSGQWVGSPMTANLIEATQITTDYADDAPTLPRRVHLGRTIGGPLMNLTVAALTFIAWQINGSHLLRFTALINLLLAVLVLLPIKGFDGEIFWRELRRQNKETK